MLSLIVEQVGVGVAVVDNDANFLYANATFAAMHGCTVEQLRAKQYKGSVFSDPSEWNGPVQTLMQDTLATGVGRAEVTRRRIDGSTFAAHVTLSLLRSEQGTLVGRIMVVADITERHQAQERLRRNERRLADAQDIARLGSWEWHPSTGVAAWSSQMFRIAGQPPGLAPSFEKYLLQVHPDDRYLVEQAMGVALEGRQPFAFSHRIVLPEGAERFIRVRGEVVLDDDGQLMMQGTAQDVTEEMQSQSLLRVANARLQELATTDALTGLPNRALFADRLEQTIAQARREGRTIAMLFLDLDRFKNINDSLGHHCGDYVLVEVSRRLLGAVRDGDTVARLGGDEFALLLSGATNPEKAATAAERVLASLRPSIVSAGTEFFVTASIGVAVWPDDCTSTAELLQHADGAMYRAKAAGGNRFEMFDASMTVAVRQRLDVESDLRRAVDSGQFFLRYQPQIDMVSGQAVAVEALVRWDHPARGEVMPGEFISLAEDTALIIPIGAWVLGQACRQAARWRAELPGRPPMRMGVNVSSRQLAHPGFVTLVRQTLAETGTPACDLELEITESTLISDSGPAVEALQTLRQLGVGIAIDDFGTGYSSLSYLRRFPVDRLKLDMSLIAGLGRGDDSAKRGDGALVAAAINLAHALGVQAVAEGVENVDQVKALVAFGCELGQGYLWTKPLLADDLAHWLERPG
jgi:diguanylate cyclase (GGDEF)-like protein/PAS domain S-box-containing protein